MKIYNPEGRQKDTARVQALKQYMAGKQYADEAEVRREVPELAKLTQGALQQVIQDAGLESVPE